MSNFEDAFIKVDRANKHIRDAENVILALIETYTMTVQRDPETGYQNLVHAAPELIESCIQLSLIAGDAFHNLRTALDYAWIAMLKKRVPSADLERVKFPVRNSR